MPDTMSALCEQEAPQWACNPQSDEYRACQLLFTLRSRDSVKSVIQVMCLFGVPAFLMVGLRAVLKECFDAPLSQGLVLLIPLALLVSAVLGYFLMHFLASYRGRKTKRMVAELKKLMEADRIREQIHTLCHVDWMLHNAAADEGICPWDPPWQR